MLTVKFRFYGQLRDVVDGPGVEMDAPEGSTLREAISGLTRKYGEDFRRRVFRSDGNIQESVNIVVGDRTVQAGDLDQKLPGPGAEVSIFVITAMQGGASRAFTGEWEAGQ